METQEQTIVVYRTGKVYQFDMVVGALQTKNIPVFTREETSGGLNLALPATLTAGPGTWWSIRVPVSCQKQAQELIDQLPCDKGFNPAVWDGIDPAVRSSMRLYYKIIAIGILAGLVLPVIRWLLNK